MFVPFEDKCKSPLVFSTFPRALKLSNCVESASDVSRDCVHIFLSMFLHVVIFLHETPFDEYFAKHVNVDD